jgi:hypothetical protein
MVLTPRGFLRHAIGTSLRKRGRASLGRLFLDVEVCGVELSGRLQPRPILNDDAAAFHCDEPVAPQLLQRSVYVDCREAGGVAELGLRDRQLVSLPAHQADGPEAHIDFTKDVRDPGVSIASADIDDPLPKHRRIDERLAPEHVGNARMRAKERANRLVRNERHLGGNDCRCDP